jgi:hypothetical protein
MAVHELQSPDAAYSAYSVHGVRLQTEVYSDEVQTAHELSSPDG